MNTLNLEKSFLVVGCGGLGCSVVESLLRLGVKKIVVCDSDRFDKSNLNRQLYAIPKNIGKLKAKAAEKRACKLHYKGEFVAVCKSFDESTADEMLDGIDIVIDALDNIKSRLFLEDECGKRNIPLVHGAVNAWTYQISVVMPGSRVLHKLFEGKEDLGSNENYSFTVAACAAKEVSEAMLLAQGIESALTNKLLYCDLEENEAALIEIE